MVRLSVYEAKLRFSELIEQARLGRPTAITKRGRVVANIVPARAVEWDRSAVLEEAEALRKTLKVRRRVNVAALIAQDRRL